MSKIHERKALTHNWAALNFKKQLEMMHDFTATYQSEIKNKIKTIKSIKSADKNFKNTLLAYEELGDESSIIMGRISALEMCSPEKCVRDLARSTQLKYSDFMLGILYDVELYNALQDYYHNNYIKEKHVLDAQDTKLTEDTMRDLSRLGLSKNKENRDKIKSIDKKISKLATAFDARLAEDKTHMLVTEEELGGLPENIKSSFARVKKNNKSYVKVTTEYPDYGPYMKYATSSKKREELYIKYNNVGGDRNVKILKKLISLRKEKAALLGYESHATFVLEDRMAKDTKSVYKMLDNLRASLQKSKDSDLKEILNKAKELSQQKEYRELKMPKASDFDFVINKLREEKYNYSEQEVREYLQLPVVMGHMFEVFGSMFSFKAVELSDKMWHKDVKLYALCDTQNKTRGNSSEKLLGHIAVDLYPRDGKFGHACMLPIVNGKDVSDREYRAPLAAIITNFSKPTKSSPSLLTIGEVETLYHEFGHAIHTVLTNAKYVSHSGSSVVWDFVETPSQIMEEWVLEENALRGMSSHYKTGKKMPKELMAKIKKSSKFMGGLFYTRQCLQATLDLDLYTGGLKDADPADYYRNLFKKYMYKEMDDRVLFVSRFSHIVRGYDAGYYSYLWAEVISRDIYGEFVKRSANKKEYKNFASKYRKEILEIGSSRDELASIRALLGRDFNSDNFAESLV